MSTPESKGASPGPWSWRPEEHSLHCLKAADGFTVAVYDRSNYPYPHPNPHESADKALLASAPEMAALLRELEWLGGDPKFAICPKCKQTYPHAPDCPLDALLTKVGR